jgi:hypothetical protein
MSINYPLRELKRLSYIKFRQFNVFCKSMKFSLEHDYYSFLVYCLVFTWCLSVPWRGGGISHCAEHPLALMCDSRFVGDSDVYRYNLVLFVIVTFGVGRKTFSVSVIV